MLAVLREPTYARLFTAQVVALLGTGLLTVALGLLAFDIAGAEAGVVLGTALTIKMIAYVGLAPLVAALTAAMPAKPVLVVSDLVRAAVAVSLPFVSEAWQIYVVIAVLQSASATFTPTFQAVIPQVLPDEGEYTRALSLSRLAYDLEALVSPALAALALAFMSYHQLFVGTVVGFVVSTGLVLAARFQESGPAPPSPFLQRLTVGARVFRRNSELRGLLAMNLVVAASTAMIVVNTVVYVQGVHGRPQSDVAQLLAAYGAGSMIVALVLPTVLDSVPDRPVMLGGASALPVGLVAVGVVVGAGDGEGAWLPAFAVWLLAGAATSLVLTPSARLLRRAAEQAELPAVFAAQFSLSHACFLLTYPLAGTVGARFGLPAAAFLLAGLAALAALGARIAWRPDPLPSRT